MPPQIETTPAKKAKPRLNLFLRIMRFLWLTFQSIVSAMIILLFSVWLLFKIPAVQNWLADQATAYLSKELQTKVSVEKVDIRLFNKASFKNFYLEDRNKDTLIYANDLVAHFDISKILKGRFVITQIDLQEGTLNFHRLEGERDYNLLAILKYFQPKNKKKKKAQFELAINHIIGHNARFHLLDEVAGTEMTINAPKAVLHARKSNLIGNFVECDSVWADKADVKIRIFKGIPLPDSLMRRADADMVKPNWNVSADKVVFKDMNFHLLNERQGVRPELPLDFNDLQLQQAQILVEKLSLKDYTVKANIRQFSTKEKRGFEIRNFYGNIMASSTGAYIKNFELQTPHSTIGNEIEFYYDKFPDFQDFVHKVKLVASVNNSQVAVKDIMAFAAPLNKVPFFITNKDKVVYLDCYFEGIVDSFTIKDIVMNMDNTHFEGNMSMQPFKKFMKFEIQDLQTNYEDLSSMLSFTKIPKQLANLGKMYFKGDFEGYFDKEFKTKGKLISDIGEGQVDLKMNPRGGINNVTYEGNMVVGDFDLGKLLNNKEFGKVDAFFNVKGKGLSIAGLEANVQDGRVNYFEFRGYRYDTIRLSGDFNQKKFVGTVSSKDPNFYLNLSAVEIDLNQARPVLDIRGSIKNLNFCELNFLTDDLILSIAKIDMRVRGNNIDDFSGRVRLNNINFHRGWGDYHIDSIFVGTRDTVNAEGLSTRVIRLRSDIASGTVRGQFNMVDLPKSLRGFAEKYYTNFIRNLDLATADSLGVIAVNDSMKFSFDTLRAQDMHVELVLHDSKKLTEIIHHDFKYIKGAELKIDYDSKQEKFSIKAKVDSLKWAGFVIKKEELIGSGTRNFINFENKVEHLQLNDSTMLPTPYVQLRGKGDSIAFTIGVNEIGNIASNINLNGDVRFNRQSVLARLAKTNLVVLDQKWYVEGDNYLSFDFKNQILKVHDLALQDSLNKQKIELSSIGDKGLQLKVSQFNLKRIYEPVKLPMFDISGTVNAFVKMENVFKQEKLSATVFFEDLVINTDKWEKMRLDVRADKLKDTISGTLTHQGPIVDNIYGDFFFIPAFATKIIADKNFVNINFEAKGAKARILEYFMVGQLTNTLGTAYAKGRIYGKAPKLNIEGLGEIKKLETTFNFLNTRYNIDSASIILTNDGFAFSPALEYDEKNEKVKSGIVIKDQEGNKGYIGGRILHNHLKEWGIDLDLVFNNNLTLNTTADKNMPFYGKVWASGTAKISGPFTKMTMMIDAETKAGPRNEQSVLVLPIMKPVEVNQAIDYIVFKDMKAPEDTSKINKRKVVTGGIEVFMKIKATPDAMARIIIDEQAGDVIEGSGNGNMQLNYTPSGEMFLYGDYEIEQGNYLFTYRNFINKPFKVEKGGTIRWNGDPYNAEVNLKAKYTSKFTLYNLLLSYQEEMQNTETRNAANIPVAVDVLMFMTGSLLRPDIKFGLDIVGATQGRAATLANLALRAIQQDESKLNRQVFGLIALNQFLPEENAAANLNIGASSFNTLSEMISQQFSRYLGDLLSEVVEGSDFISSVDVQIGYKMEDDQLSNSGTGSQFDMSFDNYLFNDKLRIHIGANVDFNNNNVSGTNQNYFGGDFIVEYAITENGNLKVRAYNRSESSLFGQRIRTGGGLSYSLEFDSFKEMVQEIKRNAFNSRQKAKLRKETRKRRREEKEMTNE